MEIIETLKKVLHLSFLFAVAACAGKESSQASGTFSDPAIESVSQKIAENPNDPGLYAARASLYFQQEGYDEAILDLQKAISIDSTQPPFYFLLADVYLRYFKSRQALEIMDRATERFPDHLPTLLKQADLQFTLKQYDASLRTLDRLLRLDPQFAEAFFLMGMNFRETGDTIRAINSFQKAVETDSDLTDAWILLGQLHNRIGNPKLAEQYLDNAIRINPESIQALHAKAEYLQERERLAEAISLYRQIVRIDPHYEQASFNAGLLYLELDSVEQAYRQFDITLNISPLHIKGYYYRGLAAELLGNLPQARSDYQQALQLAPDYLKAQESLQRVQPAEQKH